MITTVTLNPCIDKTVFVDKFEIGSLNRIVSSRQDLAGKGLNVAKILKNFNYKTRCLGFDFNNQIKNAAESQDIENTPLYGINCDFVNVDGVLRTNIKLVDQSTSVMTEINESSYGIQKHYITELLNKIDTYISDTEVFVLSGSVPPNVPKDIYAQIIRMVKSKNNHLPIILDADKEAFVSGIAASPDIIKPNLYELESSFGVSLSNPDEIIQFVRDKLLMNVKKVCVSLGADGALLIDKKLAYHAKAENAVIKGLAGAGDSLVAGICMGIMDGMNAEQTLLHAVCVATGSVSREGTLLCTANEYDMVKNLCSVMGCSDLRA